VNRRLRDAEIRKNVRNGAMINKTKHTLFLHISFSCILFMAASSPASIKARFYFPGGERKVAQFLYMQNDTIHIQVTTGDGSVEYRSFHKYEFTDVEFRSGEFLDMTRSEYFYGMEQSEPQPYELQETGEYTGESPVSPTNSSSPTKLTVESDPDGAEVTLQYKVGGEIVDRKKTPAVFENITADTVRLAFFKFSYRDTVVVKPIAAHQSNYISVGLPLAEYPELVRQKKTRRQEIGRKVGTVLTVVSLAALASGGYSYYLSRRDYQEAEEAKTILTASGITEKTFKENQSKNIQKTESGRIKTSLSIGLLGGGVLSLGTGIILFF
jgi:hypothetical protein